MDTNQKRKPIRQRMRRVIVMITIVTLALAAVMNAVSMLKMRKLGEDALRERMEQTLFDLADSKANNGNALFRNFAGDVTQIADFIRGLYCFPGHYVPHTEILPGDPAMDGSKFVLQRGLATEEISYQDVRGEMALVGNADKVFAPLVAEKSEVSAVYYQSESGFMIAYDTKPVMSPAEGKSEYYHDFRESEWYQKAKETGKTCFTDVYEDLFGRGLVISCVSPVKDASGSFAGVVSLDIRFMDLYHSIIDVDMGKGTYAFLVDSAGSIVFPDDVTRPAEEDLDREEQLWERIFAREEGIFTAGSGAYYVGRPIEQVDWMLYLRVPGSLVLDPARGVDEVFRPLILITLFGVLLLAILSSIAIRRFSDSLTEPLLELRKDAWQISGGNLDYRAKVMSNDEIGDLACSFNEMAASLKQYIANLTAVTAEKERIGAELNVATQIQADMLPRIFPPFPERKELDLFALMDPAKEVGGDFYDFFLIDSDHLCMVMADVAGKGVPAALFMVIAKTLLKNRAMMGGGPSEILGHVNNQLCKGNDAELFVTVWLGILQISTGKGIAANAGHEHPAVFRRESGRFELDVYQHSPALAIMENMPFREREFVMHPGDSLFVYTDGVCEATNAENELFGTDRLLDALNGCPAGNPREQVRAVREAIDDFVKGSPQFDDITMLSMHYNGPDQNLPTT